MNIKFETIGSDPEFFIFKDGKAFPAVKFTSGSKDKPEIIKEGFALQKDNLLIEGNIPPCRSKSEFVESITFLKDYIRSRIELEGFELVCADSAKFMPRFLRIPEAFEFGCEPYKLAWGRGMRHADDLSRISERVAGFHIHIGYNSNMKVPSNDVKQLVVRAFDLFVTMPSRKIHFDEIRSTYYGKLGSYREKAYGVECRSLGGYFLNDKYLEWVWDQLIKMEDFINGLSPNGITLLLQERTRGMFGSFGYYREVIPISLYEKLNIKEEAYVVV